MAENIKKKNGRPKEAFNKNIPLVQSVKSVLDKRLFLGNLIVIILNGLNIKLEQKTWLVERTKPVVAWSANYMMILQNTVS